MVLAALTTATFVGGVVTSPADRADTGEVAAPLQGPMLEVGETTTTVAPTTSTTDTTTTTTTPPTTVTPTTTIAPTPTPTAASSPSGEATTAQTPTSPSGAPTAQPQAPPATLAPTPAPATPTPSGYFHEFALDAIYGEQRFYVTGTGTVTVTVSNLTGDLSQVKISAGGQTRTGGVGTSLQVGASGPTTVTVTRTSSSQTGGGALYIEGIE